MVCVWVSSADLGSGPCSCVYIPHSPAICSLLVALPPQGRGSGFPGRRRPRGAGLSGRAGRGRARGKNGAGPSINPGVCTFSSASYGPAQVMGGSISGQQVPQQLQVMSR